MSRGSFFVKLVAKHACRLNEQVNVWKPQALTSSCGRGQNSMWWVCACSPLSSAFLFFFFSFVLLSYIRCPFYFHILRRDLAKSRGCPVGACTLQSCLSLPECFIYALVQLFVSSPQGLTEGPLLSLHLNFLQLFCLLCSLAGHLISGHCPLLEDPTCSSLPESM